MKHTGAQLLLDYIHHIQPLTDDEAQQVSDVFTYQSVSKNEYWIQAGNVCNEIAFVCSGRLRVFYYDEDGHEITCYIMPDNNFISSFTSFLTRTPSFENIMAIENTALLIASRDEIEKLSADVPKIQILRRVIAENLFITMENRVSMLQSQSAHERYMKMMQEDPDILLHVPLQYTASFLGITPQHLSRLRKKRMP